MENERRKFLSATFKLGLIAAMSPQMIYAGGTMIPGTDDKDGDGFTFLFQGESITDGNRTRNNDWNHIMGHGYQYIIASRLWFDFPKKNFHFFNRGISGNKVTDLAARWQKDTLEIKPGLLSILIGINDTSAFINGKTDYDAAHYESAYRNLLKQTKIQLPDVQFVLCEPFILKVGKVKEKWELYSTETNKRREIVKRLAEEFGAIFVKFQTAFDKALSRAPGEYWIWDGIHPMPAGHELMAREWLSVVSKKVKLIR